MKIITAPDRAPKGTECSIFLAGSIDMGRAINWQDEFARKIADLDVVLYNPRREAFDATMEQKITNAPFREQVEWELDHLDQADLICCYFDQHGKAPITLMELGLYANSGKLIVACPEGYWRRGNVEIVCARYDIPFFETLDELVAEARVAIEDFEGLNT